LGRTIAVETATLVVDCGASVDREDDESLDKDSCDPADEVRPNKEISSTRGSSSGAGAAAAGALGSQDEDALATLRAEAGIDDKASKNCFDCFTTFTKESSLSECLLTPEFPFNATALSTAATAIGGTIIFFIATFAYLPASLS
jgi:hypothetical protein